MRKTFFLSIIFITVVLTLLSIFLLYKKVNVPEDMGTFNLSEYQFYIDYFPSDKNVGIVDNQDTAIKIAKELWQEEFSVNIKTRKMKIAYDYQNDCWYVRGWEGNKNTVGGAYGTIIKKSGEVITVWWED